MDLSFSTNSNIKFKSIAWADNADACSIQYAGTPALKTDFTRTGKRRLYGKLQDGVNSLIRYYKNNFEDGFRQDSFDLLLGRYRVQRDEAGSSATTCNITPLSQRNMLKIVSFPIFLLISFSLLFFALLFPTERWINKCYNILYSLSFSATVIILMFRFSRNFVDFPTLVPVTKPWSRLTINLQDNNDIDSDDEREDNNKNQKYL